jgi:hypothetical protein
MGGHGWVSRRADVLLMLTVLLGLAGCVGMATQRLADNLSVAILNQNDPETVKDGAPAYLLLVDGLIEGDPGDEGLLLAGARLYAAYAAVFVEDAERAGRLAERSLDYAGRALAVRGIDAQAWQGVDFAVFEARIQGLGAEALPAVYAYAAAWAVWVRARRDDWEALAALPRVEALMERVLALDPAYENGQPHLYLGVMRTWLPPAMGGRPEQGRVHFERAIALSAGRNLMAKVEYARRYARLVFDRELHDRLLGEVLAADAEAPGLTLTNVLAKRQARALLADADEYF